MFNVNFNYSMNTSRHNPTTLFQDFYLSILLSIERFFYYNRKEIQRLLTSEYGNSCVSVLGITTTLSTMITQTFSLVNLKE